MNENLMISSKMLWCIMYILNITSSSFVTTPFLWFILRQKLEKIPNIGSKNLKNKDSGRLVYSLYSFVPKNK